jgi:hypothetical protein
MQATPRDHLKEIAMKYLHPLISEVSTDPRTSAPAADAGHKAGAETRHRRPRAKWADLHEALAHLLEARALAEPAEPTGDAE